MLVMTKEQEIVVRVGEKNIGDEQFRKQRGVAVDEDDNIYITDRKNNCVLKFNSKGDLLASTAESSTKVEFAIPTGICFNKKNRRLYVCDRNNCRIQVLNTDLEPVSCFGEKGKENGQFLSPRYATFDQSNELYVADYRSDRVQVFSADGEFLRKFSRKGKEETLEEPYGIAVDSSNIVYVSETKRNCISMFTTNGVFLTSFGQVGKEEGQFNRIRGLHIDSKDSLLVSDAGNDRLQIFHLSS